MKIIRNKNSQVDPNKFYVVWGSQGHVGFYSEPYNSESDAYAAIDAAGASDVRNGVGPEDDYLTVMKGSQVKPPMGMPPQKVESIVSNWNGFVREYNSRKSNAVHKFTGSLELTDDEKSEVNETIKEFWDDSKPLESYIKVLNYFIKNWGINVKDIPTNQFKTIEDLMDWEGKNFGHVPSLIGNIENYIATELTDYVDQLPSQYNSRKSNSIPRDIHMEVKSAYKYLKSHLRYPEDLDCVVDRYSNAWCYLILIPKSNSNEDSQIAIKKVISEGLMDVTEDYQDKYPEYIVLSSDEMPQGEKPLVHVIRKSSRQSNSMLPQADTKVVDLYVAKANNDNYLDILKDIAKELGEHFDVRKEFDTPNEFRAWAEKNDKISDRMYIIIDYVLGGVTGMKKGERHPNSRQVNTPLFWQIVGNNPENIEKLTCKYDRGDVFEIPLSGDIEDKINKEASEVTPGNSAHFTVYTKDGESHSWTASYREDNSRQVNNIAASVDIDLKRGFTVGDLTVKVEGDTIIIHAEDPNGNHANEFLRTKDPIYAIKTILSRASNWVGSKQNSRQVNADLSTKISQINEKIAEKGYKANWDSENDQIEIKGKDSDIVTLTQEGNKLILSRWDDVVYISIDFDKVLKELVNQLGKN